MQDLGRAMIRVAERSYPRQVLECVEITRCSRDPVR
jgi:hypothetical protein